MTNIFDQDLDPNSANFTALSPVSFVERSAEIFGDLRSVVHGHRKYTWAQTRDRSARLAAALQSLGVARGTTVSAMLPNTPEMLEVHYAVPALNAVLNPLNTRLDAALIAWQLNHCECAVLITDREFAPVMAKALDILKTQFGRSIVVVDVCDSEYTGPGEQLGQYEYEAWLASHETLVQIRRSAKRVGCHCRQLHQRHHWRPQRCCHASPRRLPERCEQCGHLDHAALPHLFVDLAHVPLQRLVLSLDSGHAGWHPCVFAPSRSSAHLRCHARTRRQSLLRCPHRSQPHLQRPRKHAGWH